MLKTYSLSDAFTVQTRKVKNVTKVEHKIGEVKKKNQATKKKYADGFTPPDPSSEDIGSEASVLGPFKTEEDRSDDKDRMEFDEDLCVRYVDETLHLACFHPYFTPFYILLLF